MSTLSTTAIQYDLRLLGLTIGSICSRANVGMLYQRFLRTLATFESTS